MTHRPELPLNCCRFGSERGCYHISTTRLYSTCPNFKLNVLSKSESPRTEHSVPLCGILRVKAPIYLPNESMSYIIGYVSCKGRSSRSSHGHPTTVVLVVP